MNKFVQIRNVPEAKHRKLKARAAETGLSISEYVTKLIDEDLAQRKPTFGEWIEHLKTLPPIQLKESGAQTIRAIRDEIDRS